MHVKNTPNACSVWCFASITNCQLKFICSRFRRSCIKDVYSTSVWINIDLLRFSFSHGQCNFIRTLHANLEKRHALSIICLPYNEINDSHVHSNSDAYGIPGKDCRNRQHHLHLGVRICSKHIANDSQTEMWKNTPNAYWCVAPACMINSIVARPLL